MSFPPQIAAILDRFGVEPATKVALYDLYVSLGPEAIEQFANLAEKVGSPSDIRPEDLESIRWNVVETYLRRCHPQWLEGKPTPSLWHPRLTEGRAAGLTNPLGRIGDTSDEFVMIVERLTEDILGAGQPVPNGVLLLGRNAHYGGRIETISFDIVPETIDDALAIAHAQGQQHTTPGSVGETSGTLDPVGAIALIWEVQPNVLKPAGDRNKAIAKLYRKHRNWHVATLVAALEWLRVRAIRTFLLRGSALATTHEVNPNKPVSDTIVELHDRTVTRVVEGLGATLAIPNEDDAQLIINSEVMNHALRKHVERYGAKTAMWRYDISYPS